MRFEGTLDSWYAERGHGLVAPEQGGEPLFVHVSAFPMDGQPPNEGERVSFEVVAKSDGSKQAVRLQRLTPFRVPAQLRAPRTASRPRPIAKRRRVSALMWMVMGVLALGFGATLWPPAGDPLLAQRVSATASR
ncbi:cold-shock protein [Roseateles amylovorans]|uniref:Cold shock domain-containing protein n=1 Tax=Roseateles amylovorans TaxID=2978473 RepID=A0ABY6B0K3_9BURK|nr:cold shock domain-containing protein [Roseateles amylovorans]UXH77509.1 cold shock domain-containing protein [Roseateles amylovorans]